MTKDRTSHSLGQYNRISEGGKNDAVLSIMILRNGSWRDMKTIIQDLSEKKVDISIRKVAWE